MSYASVRRYYLPAAGALVAFFFLAPYLVMFLTALKPQNELFKTPPVLFPHHWQWANFIDVWHAAPIAGYLKVTLIIATLATLLVLVVSLPAAYYTARNSFRGRKAFLVLVVVTQMFAPTALVIGLYREFLNFHLVDTYWALVITDAAFNLAFSIWILNAYFASIPKELEEASWLDGYGPVRTLFKVILPTALPGVVTAVIFTFIAAWNEFVVALTLINTPSKLPLTVGIESFIGQYEVQYNYLFAASLVAIVPVVILFALIERYLVGGLTAGSIK